MTTRFVEAYRGHLRPLSNSALDGATPPRARRSCGATEDLRSTAARCVNQFLDDESVHQDWANLKSRLTQRSIIIYMHIEKSSLRMGIFFLLY
jgi:hypothetical protein